MMGMPDFGGVRYIPEGPWEEPNLLDKGCEPEK